MENNFSLLIRKSPIVSLVKNQVLSSKSTNYGLKYPIIEKQSIIYDKMKPTYKSGLQKISHVERFKELFNSSEDMEALNLKQNYHLGEKEKKPLESLSPQEWNSVIQKAREKQEEFYNQLQQNKLNEMSWKEFMGIDKLEKLEMKKFPIIYTNSKKQGIVRGRILRALNGKTLLVGVQGFVCTLESIDIPAAYKELQRYVQLMLHSLLISY